MNIAKSTKLKNDIIRFKENLDKSIGGVIFNRNATYESRSEEWQDSGAALEYDEVTYKLDLIQKGIHEHAEEIEHRLPLYALPLLRPVPHQDHQVFKVYAAVSIDVTCHNRLTHWLTEVALTRLHCPTIRTHIDHTTIWERLEHDRTVGIAHVNAGAGDIVLNPGLAMGVPSSCLALEVIVAIYPKVIVRVIGCTIGIPIAGQGKD